MDDLISQGVEHHASIFQKSMVSERVRIKPHELHKNFEEVILRKLRGSLEGKCNRNGYVKKNSIKLHKISNGVFETGSLNGDVTFTVIYHCDICNPAKGDIIPSVVINTNKFGVLSQSGTRIYTEDGKASRFIPVIEIVIPRQVYRSDVDLDKVNVGDFLNVQILGTKFKLNGAKIRVTARGVSHRREYDSSTDDAAPITTTKMNTIVDEDGQFTDNHTFSIQDNDDDADEDLEEVEEVEEEHEEETGQVVTDDISEDHDEEDVVDDEVVSDELSADEEGADEDDDVVSSRGGGKGMMQRRGSPGMTNRSKEDNFSLNVESTKKTDFTKTGGGGGRQRAQRQPRQQRLLSDGTATSSSKNERSDLGKSSKSKTSGVGTSFDRPETRNKRISSDPPSDSSDDGGYGTDSIGSDEEGSEGDSYSM